ncbi:MAG: nucleotidyltransferase family protein [Planctomycetota bacterium]|nr:nucleotidyltransferase family protein [Planctomycetota bacterium]
MERRPHIEVPTEKLVEFCQRHHIRRLAFFGSVLRDDFRPDSDVDVLVEFEPGHVPGLLGLAGLEIGLSGLLGGRKVDLNTPGFFGPVLRERIQAEAVAQYG